MPLPYPPFDGYRLIRIASFLAKLPSSILATKPDSKVAFDIDVQSSVITHPEVVVTARLSTLPPSKRYDASQVTVDIGAENL